jgi:hypothetical protein
MKRETRKELKAECSHLYELAAEHRKLLDHATGETRQVPRRKLDEFVMTALFVSGFACGKLSQILEKNPNDEQ